MLRKFQQKHEFELYNGYAYEIWEMAITMTSIFENRNNPFCFNIYRDALDISDECTKTW